MKRTMVIISLAALLVLPGAAYAQGPGGGGPRGRGMGMGGGMGHGMRGCGMALIHAHPDVLKAKFGLTDGQVSQLAPLRTGFLTKRIQLHSQVQQLGLQMKGLFEADLPDQNKVLDVSRKIRNLQGQIAEERIKTMLKIMQVLTKDQRTQLRAHCPMPGMGMGMGMGKGKGEGWGEGGGPGGGWGGGQ